MNLNRTEKVALYSLLEKVSDYPDCLEKLRQRIEIELQTGMGYEELAQELAACNNKLVAVKRLKSLTGMGLYESKKLVERILP